MLKLHFRTFQCRIDTEAETLEHVNLNYVGSLYAIQWCVVTTGIPQSSIHVIGWYIEYSTPSSRLPRLWTMERMLEDVSCSAAYSMAWY